MSFSDILNLEQKKLKGPDSLKVVKPDPIDTIEHKKDMHLLQLFNLARSNPYTVINYSVLSNGTITYNYEQKSIG